MNVNRRRKGPGPEGRAEAPQRDTGGSQGSGQPPAGGYQRPSFGGMPTRGKQIGGCGTILVVVLIVGYYLLSGGQGIDLGGVTGTGTENGGQELPGVEQVNPELPVSNYTPPVPAASGSQTWTVMLYQDADDQMLERDIYLDLNEVERVGSSPNVNIVAQLDRFRGGYQGDGDWTTARRYYITQDNDLNHVNSQVAEDLGEVNMADGQTLVDFVQWAAKNYPADHYVLILSDHGMGWPGGWSDPDPGGSDASRAPLAARLGENIYLGELDQALEQAQQQAGIDKFEIIGMDACLMSQLEVMAALQPHANYAVTSEEVEPSIGWAYASFLGDLVINPDISGEQLSRLIVDSYIIDDQRIQDPAARAEFMRAGSPLSGLFGMEPASADQLSAQLSHDATMAALDLNALPDLMNSFNSFAYALQDEDQELIAQARDYAQSYTSIFGSDVPASYIDLGNFVLLMQANTSNGRVKQAADAVISSLEKVVMAEKHGAGLKGSTGLSIYFPNSTLYGSRLAGPQSYTEIAKRFAAESLWDDFLAYHYMDRGFEQSPVQPYVPPSGYSVRAPGLGHISLSEITASSHEAAPGQPVKLSIDISGGNIGYIYLFVGYLDQNANSLNFIDTDYLESPDTRQVNGVYYPVWKDEGFTMNFTWDPIVFAISDGQQKAVALFKPEQYGASAEDASYAVDGVYTFTQTGETRFAQLRFQNGALVAVYGFNGEGEDGAPREITPQAGDTFTIYETWMDLDANGNVTGTVKEAGKTLTFGAEPFTWVELYAAQGDYVVGFNVEDLDGNSYPKYTNITVK
jgi:hypothetical protein